MRLTLLSVLLTVIGILAHAQVSVRNGNDVIIVNPGASTQNLKYIQRFRQAAIRAIENAEKSGLQEVQGISLKKIKQAAEKVRIEYNATIKVRQENRRCAYWNKEAHDVQVIGTNRRVSIPAKITLYDDCENLSDRDLEAIALHEILGVAFNTDFKYEISTQILSANFAPPPKNKLINRKSFDARLKELKSGGSTGVGGGGDFHDLRFKLEGLKYLQSQNTPKIFGIPTELLRIAIQEMKVRPAADIEKLVEFRGPGIEGDAIAYIMSSLYRDQSAEGLGFLAVFTARLFIIHAPYEIGLVDDQDPLLLTLRDSTIVQDPCFYLPAPELKHSFVHWSDPNVNRDQTACVDQLTDAVGFSNSELGKALIRTLENLAVIRTKPSPF